MNDHDGGSRPATTPIDVASVIERNNLKLTADKILDGLATARNNARRSNRRWVWELMQNARDVPNRFDRVTVAIELRDDTLTFRHNGDAFHVDHLAGLIQQVSAKSQNNIDPDMIGKFGTGFITTHLLADVVHLSGIVQRPADQRRRFELTLDRSAATSAALQTKIQAGVAWLCRIDDECSLVSGYEERRQEGDLDTIFQYVLATEANRAVAVAGIDDLLNTLPVTLVNLPKIKEVQIHRQDGSKQCYGCTSEHLDEHIIHHAVEILDSRAPIKHTVHFLAYEASEHSLLVRVDNLDNLALIAPDSLPRLYRGFPLIGSEKFHLPFILAGNTFYPTEQRDGLLLNGTTKEVSKNHEVLEAAGITALAMTDWLISHGAKNLHILANTRLPEVDLEEVARERFAARQRGLRSALLDRSLVETDAGPVKLRSARIPNSHSGASESTNTELRRLAAAYLGDDAVPRKDLLAPWIAALGTDEEYATWGHPLLLTTANLVERVASEKSLAGLSMATDTEKYEWLNDLYSYLSTSSELSVLLESNAIVPNQNGNFQKLSGLYRERSDDPIPKQLLDVLTKLGSDWRGSLLDRSIEVPVPNSRQRGLGEASVEINRLLQLKSADPERPKLLWNAIIAILRLTTRAAKDDSYRRQLFTFANELIHFDSKLHEVESLESFQFLTATKMLTNSINHKIAEQKTMTALAQQLRRPESDARVWLGLYLSLLEENADHKALLDNYAIAPNRLGVLCPIKNLHAFGTQDQPLDSTLVDILKDLDPGKDLRPTLLADDIHLNLAPYSFDKLGNELAASVDKVAGKEEAFREPLLRLIAWCNNNRSLTERYLKPLKDLSKAIFFKLTIAGNESGDQIMQIMLKPEKISDLAALSSSGADLKDLRTLAALEPDTFGLVMTQARELQEKKSSFRFLQRIGATMERLFRQALDDAGIAAKIDFLGRGPWDFELTNLSNGKMFYIELKSWRIDQGERPIRLALSQALQAAAGDKPYAICVVGRHARVEDVISAEIGTNLYYLRDLAPHFASVSADIRFIEEMKGASGEIRLDLPGIQQAKVLLSHSFIRRNGRTFADLIVDIQTALS